jgi:hypothetical protein
VTAQVRATVIQVDYGVLSSPNSLATAQSFTSGSSLHGGFAFIGQNAGMAAPGDSIVNEYQAPANISSDYAHVGTGAEIVETFLTPVDYFGLYWGSPDSYNKITFVDAEGQESSFAPGVGDLSELNPNQITPAYVEFFNNSDVPWISATFTSSAPAFEFANVATANEPTPEPGAIALCAGGLIVLGVKRRAGRGVEVSCHAITSSRRMATEGCHCSGTR